MQPAEKNNSFLQYIIMVMMAGLMLWSVLLFAAQGDENQAPGRTMAQQATKGKKIWNTIIHTDKVACQRCHIPEFSPCKSHQGFLGSGAR